MNNGDTIPCIGYGTWKLPDGEPAAFAVQTAIEAGFRHIDTAAAYANENGVGQGIRSSGIGREDLFITGKLWNTDRSYEGAHAACRRSLKNLGLDYLDLYLMHWPATPVTHENWAEINSDVWRAFEELHGAGLVRAIGVCNFKPHHLEPLLKRAKIPPAVNQIEFHPGQLQLETREFCSEHEIIVEAWSPLGSGKLLKKAELAGFAEKYGKSPAQICIRWCIQNNTLPLPKTKTAERIRENLDIFDFEITQRDMELMNALPFLGGSRLDPDTLTLFG